MALAPTTRIDHSESSLLKKVVDWKKWVYMWIKNTKQTEFLGFWWNELFKTVCGIKVDWCTKEEG